jgi:hypothetical protein
VCVLYRSISIASPAYGTYQAPKCGRPNILNIAGTRNNLAQESTETHKYVIQPIACNVYVLFTALPVNICDEVYTFCYVVCIGTIVYMLRACVVLWLLLLSLLSCTCSYKCMRCNAVLHRVFATDVASHHYIENSTKACPDCRYHC